MSDLISREEAIESIRKHGSLPEFAEFLLNRIPAVDAALVVKCSQCAFLDRQPCPARDPETGKTKNLKYCSVGERKDDPS